MDEELLIPEDPTDEELAAEEPLAEEAMEEEVVFEPSLDEDLVNEELLIPEEDVYEAYDADGDGVVDAAIIDADGDGIPDIVLDTTGDGELDTLLVNPVIDENGDIFAEDVQEISGVGIVMGDGEGTISDMEVGDVDSGMDLGGM